MYNPLTAEHFPVTHSFSRSLNSADLQELIEESPIMPVTASRRPSMEYGITI